MYVSQDVHQTGERKGKGAAYLSFSKGWIKKKGTTFLIDGERKKKKLQSVPPRRGCPRQGKGGAMSFLFEERAGGSTAQCKLNRGKERREKKEKGKKRVKAMVLEIEWR